MAAPDFIAPLLPDLLDNIGTVAPRVRVELAPYSKAAVRDLADGRYDVVVATSRTEHEGLRSEPIGRWPWAVYGRRDHPAFRDWSVETWGAFPHLQIRIHTPSQTGGPVDLRAAERGIQRVVGAIVPHFMMAAPILARTNLLLTVPTIVMTHVASVYGLASREAPFELPALGLSVFRNAVAGSEPAVRWFAEHVTTAARQLVES